MTLSVNLWLILLMTNEEDYCVQCAILLKVQCVGTEAVQMLINITSLLKHFKRT